MNVHRRVTNVSHLQLVKSSPSMLLQVVGSIQATDPGANYQAVKILLFDHPSHFNTSLVLTFIDLPTIRFVPHVSQSVYTSSLQTLYMCTITVNWMQVVSNQPRHSFYSIAFRLCSGLHRCAIFLLNLYALQKRVKMHQCTK